MCSSAGPGGGPRDAARATERAGAASALAAAGHWGQATLDHGSRRTCKNKFDTVLGNIGFDMKGDVTAPGYVWYVWKNGQYDYRTGAM